MPLGVSRNVQQFIDDAASDDGNDGSELSLSVHESDILFINDDTDLSVHSAEGAYIVMDDESELSALSLEETDVDKGNKSDGDIVVVSTPSKRAKKTRRSRPSVTEVNSDEEAASIVPGDSMFVKKNGVKASTLPPAMPTRSSTRSTSKPAFGQSDDNGSKVVRPPSSFSAVARSNPIFATAFRSDPAIPVDRGDVSAAGVPVDREDVSAAGEGQPTRQDDIVSGQSDAGAVASLLPSMPITPVSVREPVPRTPSTPPVSLETRMESIMARFMENQMPFIAAAVINKVLPVINSAVAVGNNGNQLHELPKSDSASSTGQPVIEGPASGAPGSAEDKRTSSSAVHASSAVDRQKARTSKPEDDLKGTARNAKPGVVPGGEIGGVRTEGEMKGKGPAGRGDEKDSEGRAPSTTLANMDKIFAMKRKQLASGSVGAPPDDVGRKSSAGRSPAGAKKQRVAEDDLTQRVNYTPPVQCEVNEEHLQDDAIKDIYVGLPALRGGKAVLPSFDRNPEEMEGTIGGRLSFSIWETILCHATAATLLNAMVFTRTGGYFVNPSRVSPALMTLKATVMGAPGTHRLSVGNHAAICVSAGMCMASHIMEAVQSGGSPPRFRKYVDLLMHNQDWERWAAFMCICYGYNVLRASITAKAVSMTTRLGQADMATQVAALSKISKKPIFSYFKSPKKGESSSEKQAKPTTAYPSTYSLNFNDTIPVYDARDRELDFDVLLPSLDISLPKWTGGEIPIASFIVVGYSVASYMGKAQGVDGRTMHIGSNILWVIICGTPDPGVLDASDAELDMDED
ncbi:hypothetical protein R3P38DRAFT_2812571 [Favolaschia claudopus]|uniref:Uncharacterized protein n=1 Tax=Favolaschia claudopus TaxID=2862362 RepID=A0AAV9Z679_9AGAR